MFKKSLGALVAAAFIGLASSANAMVMNGGFEAGDFTGWSLGGNTGNSAVSGCCNYTGTYGAYFGPTGSVGTLSQTISTMAGASYTIDFWLRNGNSVPPHFFSAAFDGMTLNTINAAGVFQYTQFSYMATATGTNTLLQFSFQHDAGLWNIDDVSVTLVPQTGTPIPEPGTLALFGLGLAGLGLARRRKAA